MDDYRHRTMYKRAGVELKAVDTTVSHVPSSTSGTITSSVNVVAQGSGEDERVGRKINIKALHFRYRLTLPLVNASATEPDSDLVRVIFFVDRQTNGTAATVTDVLESADVHSYCNLSNQGRFAIIWDRVDILTAVATTKVGADYFSPSVHDLESFDQSINVPVEFSGVTGAVSEMTSHNIGVLSISLNGLGNLDGISRIRYVG